VKASVDVYNMTMKLLINIWKIISKYPLIGDSVLMLLVAGSTFFNLHTYQNSQPPPLNAPLTITFALLAIIPLAWRWLFLTTALIFIMAAFVTIDILNIPPINFSSIAAIISVFSAAAYGGNRRTLACTASIFVYNGGLIYKLMFSGNVVFFSSATLFNFAGLFWSLVTFLVVWRFGNTLRISRERTSLLSTSAKQVVRGTQKNARWAVFYELGRITQGLYGILAHNIRVMVIHAGVALQVLKQYPKKALNSLNRIKQSIQYVVVEVYRIFSPIWDEKQFEPCVAQSSLQQQEKLVTHVQTSEPQVKVKVEGEKDEVPQTG
jgi:hypothetical protein